MPGGIELSELTKCYGSVVAVSGLSLDIEPGEVFGLLGPNGAGKSTTLYMLSGLVWPTSGAITILGKDLRKSFLEISKRMGVLVERPSFYHHLTAKKNLLLLARLAQREVTVDRALDRVGLLYAAARKVGTFSQGMRQRLGLAQALLTEPEVLILDEPAAGLDVESSQEILGFLRRLADEAKVTIVFSTHLLHEVERLCDRVAIMNEGRLVACEGTDHFFSYDQRRVEVLLDAAEAAARRLEGQAWVESVHARPGRLRVVLREANVHQLNTFLVGAGYKVSGVIPRRRTLEDYFVKVLGT